MLFELATPTRMLISADVEEVVAPGTEGYFGVWPGHAPFLTTLGSGEVCYKTGRDEKCLAVSGGFAEVTGERVIILAESAELPEEIDRGACPAREAAGRATVEREEPARHARGHRLHTRNGGARAGGRRA